MDDTFFMEKALVEAGKALKLGEVPIGAIISYEGKIIGSGFNMRNTLKNTLKHAEIIAIDEASKKIGDWRLEKCTIYVTVEPCAMCAGAILQSRMERLVFGARNPKAGCAGSVLNILQNDDFNHKVEIGRELEEECSEIIKSFFSNLRALKKA